MDVFSLTRSFPKEELYSLTDQLRRSSRSVPSNIREGYAKRRYINIFIRHLTDALGSAEETKTWLDISRDCTYLDLNMHKDLTGRYENLTAMIFSLSNNWETFEKRVDGK
jgi:four helix bundle protein